ncbi:MAG: hypothetical protein KKG47_07070 [Proteobacteria bacterium]|nr:hypothetical protein [Pseudomonadota bacterium]
MLKNFLVALSMLSILTLFTACSGEESVSEKASRKVDEITTKAADKAVTKIRTPIDKAKLTKTLGNDRVESIDKALENK